MTTKAKAKSLTIEIAADLDAATAGAAHASLVSALDAAEAGKTRVALTLGDERQECAPLALQLLASAERSFPTGTLSLDERAASALATLTHSKES